MQSIRGPISTKFMPAIGALDLLAGGAGQARLLVLVGVDEGTKVNSAGRYRVAGSSDIFKLIPESIKYDRVNLRWQALRQGMRPELGRYDCVLNLVTDPDQQPRTLEAVQKLLRGYRGRAINRPDAVLRTTRDLVAKRLAGTDGLRVPKVIRLRNPKAGAASKAAERAGMTYPLIVRLAGTHTGRVLGIIEDAAGLDAICIGREDFILIEFVDYRSADGLFRKYRLWAFGKRTIFRHMVAGDDWNVHVKERLRFMLDRDDLIAEERQLLARPEGVFPPIVHSVFDAVRTRMGLDFFGMDFAIGGDGRVILFEANATMNFFPLEVHEKFSYLGGIEAPAREAFVDMLGFGG
jgi:hypothetical protein